CADYTAEAEPLSAVDEGGLVRVVTSLLLSLGFAVCASPVFAQTSTPGLDHLGTLTLETGTRTAIENGPQGTRTVVQVVGGRFEGPRLKATVQTPAGDWITNRPDGSYRLDVRLTLKTDDGALILVTYNGI